MRPRDTALRAKYVEASEVLRAEGKQVTPQLLSEYLSLPQSRVRTFLGRNPELAKRIHLKRVHKHTSEEYIKAIKTILTQGMNPTHRAIGEELGITRASVSNFFLDNPQIDQKTGEVKEASGKKKQKAEPQWMVTLRNTGEITVQYYDVRVLRPVLDKVNPHTYIQLWDKGYLLFQLSKRPKPKFLPSKMEVEDFLKRAS